jgi:hypothetical protein
MILITTTHKEHFSLSVRQKETPPAMPKKSLQRSQKTPLAHRQTTPKTTHSRILQNRNDQKGEKKKKNTTTTTTTTTTTSSHNSLQLYTTEVASNGVLYLFPVKDSAKLLGAPPPPPPPPPSAQASRAFFCEANTTEGHMISDKAVYCATRKSNKLLPEDNKGLESSSTFARQIDAQGIRSDERYRTRTRSLRRRGSGCKITHIVWQELSALFLFIPRHRRLSLSSSFLVTPPPNNLPTYLPPFPCALHEPCFVGTNFLINALLGLGIVYWMETQRRKSKCIFTGSI